MDELFLLPAEEKKFVALSADLQNGWRVEKEGYHFTDSADLQKLRFRMLRIHDPVLLAYKDRLVAAKSPEELQEGIRALDCTKIGNHEFIKLLFALGPDALSIMIADALEKAETKEDVELVAALCGLRHLMLESLIESDF